ncbi:hypothetical protein BC829DRAFT_418160 [Chytridium lagenaria]|nr:hypothetical protein BC829DRAFT_418160 [Chytridium lagenaria]
MAKKDKTAKKDAGHQKETITVKSKSKSKHGLSFKSMVVEFKVFLPPVFARKPGQGVLEYLSKFLLRYVPEVGGVVISFNDVQLLQTAARIMYECPYSTILISATLTVFSPEVDSVTLFFTISGYCQQSFSDHIGLLVHGVFNASIAADQIRKYEFAWRDNLSGWKRLPKDGPDAIILPGSILRFTVTGLTKANDILTLSGSLLKHTSSTGIVHQDGTFSAPPASWANPHTEGEGEAGYAEEFKEEYKEEDDLNDDDLEEDSLDDIVIAPAGPSKKKSAKGKRKTAEDEDETDEVKEDEEEESSSKKTVKGNRIPQPMDVDEVVKVKEEVLEPSKKKAKKRKSEVFAENDDEEETNVEEKPKKKVKQEPVDNGRAASPVKKKKKKTA